MPLTATLRGGALDYWVARAEGLDIARHDAQGCHVHTGWQQLQPACYRPLRYSPSTRWALGGPLVERLVAMGMRVDYGRHNGALQVTCRLSAAGEYVGDDLLEAALRCLVALSFGAQVNEA